MPKNPLKNFARRKSSGNVLDLAAEPTPPASPAPGGSTFRVLERPDKAATAAGSGGYAGGVKRTSGGRSASGLLLNRAKGKSTDDLVASANRGSGGTALSGSSGYLDNSSSSARYSSSSTLPSSVDADQDHDQDDLFPRKNANPASNRSSAASGLPEPPSFTARAGRAMSFGLRSKQSASPGAMAAAATAHMPDLPENSLIRDRAATMSSNASTAVPPRLEANLGASDFGSDFGNMFEGLSSARNNNESSFRNNNNRNNNNSSFNRPNDGSFGRNNNVLPPPPTLGGFNRSVRRPQQSPTYPPPTPAYQQRLRQESEPVLAHPSRNGMTPSPEPHPEVQPEPRRRPPNLPATAVNRYSWASRTSNDGLMSPAMASDIASPPLNPPSSFARFRPGQYQPVPDRYASPSNDHEQERAVSSGSSDSEIARPAPRKSPLSESFVAANSPQKATLGPKNTRDDLSSTDSIGESQNTTPRATHLRPNTASTAGTNDEGLFDASPAGPTSRALHPAAAQVTPRNQSQAFSPSKRMTRLEFEQQRAEAEAGAYESDESDESSEDSYDDDDEAERQAEVSRQRRKQEANLSVYRQQMKKVSGGNPSELPSATRPSFDRASFSAPGLAQGIEQEEEDDEVPLGILQAHGFPNKNRPPTRLSSAPATPGVNGDMGGNLPVFARNLPVDPYFGAGLVNHAPRESLAFGSGGSVYGGGSPSVPQMAQMQPMQPPQMPGMPSMSQPGGLVGVIAGEERARAARRINPQPGHGFNATGLPLPANVQNPIAASAMPRSNSMMSMVAPNLGMGGGMGGFGMPQMPQMPQMITAEQQNQQQMMQLMQMQQQMMQQMMAMQQGQMPQMNSPQMPNNGFPNMPNGMQRPMSMNNGPSIMGPTPPMQQQQRASTMTNLKPPGYAGSIYDYSLGPPPPRNGYTPSIAPSERSNIGMPSRYRPVTVEGSQSRTGSMTSQSGAAAFAKKNASTGSLLNPNNIPAPTKQTIKVIDKPKGSPRSPQRANADEEDDEEGWAEMKKKRQERKRRTTQTQINKQQEQALQELYQGFE